MRDSVGLHRDAAQCVVVGVPPLGGSDGKASACRAGDRADNAIRDENIIAIERMRQLRIYLRHSVVDPMDCRYPGK